MQIKLYEDDLKKIIAEYLRRQQLFDVKEKHIILCFDNYDDTIYASINLETKGD